MKKKDFFEVFFQYLVEQTRFSNSPVNEFTKTFVLYWIVKNLTVFQQEKFIELLEKKEFEEVFPFLEKAIPSFYSKLEQALEKEITRIKKEAGYDF